MNALAVDVMGGDFGPRITIPASLEFLKSYSEVSLFLVGDQDQIKQYLPFEHSNRVSVVHAPEAVSMNDKPSQFLRNGQNTSMYKAIELVSDGLAQNAISAGNTGAMMILGKRLLGCHTLIERPALVASVPRLDGGVCYVLDVGANIDCSSDQLVQLAYLGATVSKCLNGLADPQVYLLNVGTESIKGSQKVRYAANLLEEKTGEINYRGFIEANQLVTGNADVVICDGFAGNVLLKSLEGTMKLSLETLHQAFERNFFSRLLGLLVAPIIKSTAPHLDPRYKNGTLFIGLNGSLMKCHGNSDEFAFKNALKLAMDSVKKDAASKINSQLDLLLTQDWL